VGLFSPCLCPLTCRRKFFAAGITVAKQFHAGQIVPESGRYQAIHDPPHPGASGEFTLIRGRRFPTCPSCEGISFTLVFSDEAHHRNRSQQLSENRQRHRRQGNGPREGAIPVRGLKHWTPSLVMVRAISRCARALRWPLTLLRSRRASSSPQ
jgi:hypothetical protein